MITIVQDGLKSARLKGSARSIFHGISWRISKFRPCLMRPAGDSGRHQDECAVQRSCWDRRVLYSPFQVNWSKRRGPYWPRLTIKLRTN